MVCRSFIPIALFLISFSLQAEDLGSIGPTYHIAERDLIEAIQDRFRRMEKTGELAKLQDAYTRRVIQAIEQPKPLPGIARTKTARTFYLDLTWTLERNVLDEQGRVLWPSGTRINPFDVDRLSSTLLFFDARDKQQVAFAKRYLKTAQRPVKPILVAGAPLKLMREWKREVFFDQGGALSKRFAIAQSPAVVSQEGKLLRVDEIRL